MHKNLIHSLYNYKIKSFSRKCHCFGAFARSQLPEKCAVTVKYLNYNLLKIFIDK